MQYGPILDQYPIFRHVQRVADWLQLDTFVIGGFVRDILLKRSSQDIDIVCVGSGITLAQEVGKSLGIAQGVVTFKNFGTASLHWKGWDVEFVGARKESYHSQSRKPIVEAGTLLDDQKRRDFTINTLAVQLNSAHWGTLLDTFQGKEDLRKGVIKTPLRPAQTFSDDPLRMLRAIRFAVQLNMSIASKTAVAIRNHAVRINIISQERITTELNKMIMATLPSRGFYLLHQLDLLAIIFPELAHLQGKETMQGQSHKDNFIHTLQVLDNVAQKSDNLWLRWAALLHDIAKPKTKRFNAKTGFTFHGHEEVGANMVPSIFRRLRLPMRENMRYVRKLIRLHLRPIALAQEEVTDAAIRRLHHEAGDALEDLLLLCRADITSKNDAKVRRYLANFNRVERRAQDVADQDALRNFQPIITGETIMQTFGLPPSKIVGLLKSNIKEAILAGDINNEYEEAYALLLQLGIGQGLKPLTKPS